MQWREGRGQDKKAAPQTSWAAAFEALRIPSKAFHGVRKKAGVLNPVFKNYQQAPDAQETSFSASQGYAWVNWYVEQEKELRPEVPQDQKKSGYGGQIHFPYWSEKDGLKT